MSFTDEKPQVATEEHKQLNWFCQSPGHFFRCFMCGHKFQTGDYWRFILGSKEGLPNFLVCKGCDGEDVLTRWRQHVDTAKQAYWWLYAKVYD